MGGAFSLTATPGHITITEQRQSGRRGRRRLACCPVTTNGGLWRCYTCVAVPGLAARSLGRSATSQALIPRVPNPTQTMAASKSVSRPLLGKGSQKERAAMPNQTVRGRWNPWYWMRRRLGCRLLRREALGATTVSKRTQDGALIWSTRRGGPGDAFQHNCDGRRIRVSASSEPASSGKGWLLRPKAKRRIASIFTIAHLPYGQIQSSSALDHSDLASFRLNSWAAGLRSAGSKGGWRPGL